MNKIACCIGYKDRPTELGILLLSLRNQTFQDFDVLVLDDQSSSPWQNYHFLQCIVTRLRCEGHIVEIERSPLPFGVSRMRQHLADKSVERGYELICRLDDDVFLNPDYLERLLKVLEKGYDLATGVTPFVGQTFIKRETKFVKGIINRVVLNAEGGYVFNGDDCGLQYYDGATLPVDHFRSCALYKSIVHEKANYTPTTLSKHGFREEQLFSYKLILAGFKMGCDVKAEAWHLMTPSGGERFPDQVDLIKFNQQMFEEETKRMFEEHGNFIQEYHRRLGVEEVELSKEELMKENNLAGLK